MNPYRLITAFFDALETVVAGIQEAWDRVWAFIRDRVLHHLFFYLLLGITGLVVCIKAALEEVDRVMAGVERGFIAIALLIMSLLYFLMYFNREAIDLGIQADGLAKWTVTLMVWVGFLGASLATRRRTHLSVDATDRILSPKAARLVKRLTALAAAIFCWYFVDFARATVDDNLIKALRQEALPLLDWMVAPINFVAGILFAEGGLTSLSQWMMAAAVAAALVLSRRSRKAAEEVLPPGFAENDPRYSDLCHCGSEKKYKDCHWTSSTLRFSRYRASLDTVAGLGILLVLLSAIGERWSPMGEDGEAFIWEDLQTSLELAGEKEVELNAQLTDVGVESLSELVGGDDDEWSFEDEDTGAPDEPVAAVVVPTEEAAPSEDEPVDAAAPKPEAASTVIASEDIAEGELKQNFPVWLIQAVLPLSFLFMAVRFGMLAFFGRFEETLPDKKTAGSSKKLSDSKGARDLFFAGLVPGLVLGICAALGMGTGPLILLGSILLLFMGAPLFLIVGMATVACVTMMKGMPGALMMTDAFGKEVLIPAVGETRSPASQIVIDMFEAVKKEELLAIPFFVLAGNIMTQGSIAERLVGVAKAVMGRLPGGLGLATIAACVIFAAISGSSPVTVIAVGAIMFPMLMRDRYPENYSIGVLTSAGSLGIIIPPSVPMIIYAIVVGMSITQIDPACSLSPNDLFLAGVLPGLFIASMLVVYTLYQTRPGRPGLNIREPELVGGYWQNLGRELVRSIPSLLLPILILGGIYGILGPLRFTVTEAAAVAVIYALFVELVINRDLKISKLPKVFADSGVMMGGLFLIIVLAIAFNKFLTEMEVPQLAAIWLKSQIDTQLEFILLVNLFLLALGCVMDIISAILIVAPLLAPIALRFGIDPIHFGIIFIVNLELGYLTPPMGINLFVSSTVFKRGIVQVIRSTAPFFFLMLFCLGVISMAPVMSTALLGSDTTEGSNQCVDAAYEASEESPDQP